MRLHLGLLAFMLALIFTQAATNAQQPVAAVVQITHEGVQLQRANTLDWLSLRAGAQAPFGIGDTLRTNKTGRALITFDGAAETLLLPGSDYRLEVFDQTSKQEVNISLGLLNGRSIQHITDVSAFASYKLHLQHMTLQQPTMLFATQVQSDKASDVIVAQGNLTVSKDNASVDLRAGSGLRAVDALGEVIPMVAPQGFSFLSVTSATCLGIANATIPGETSVAVRIGPGENYLNLGNIPNGTNVAVVGKADGVSRYLTPFLSSYGWLIANGINVESCDNIPIVPAETQIINGVINPEPFEMDLLTPFFGTPSQNVQFYSYQ